MKVKIAQICRNDYIGFVNFALAEKLVRGHNDSFILNQFSINHNMSELTIYNVFYEIASDKYDVLYISDIYISSDSYKILVCLYEKGKTEIILVNCEIDAKVKHTDIVDEFYPSYIHLLIPDGDTTPIINKEYINAVKSYFMKDELSEYFNGDKTGSHSKAIVNKKKLKTKNQRKSYLN